MKHLAFVATRGIGSTVRRATFEERPWLPLSAACLVAGGVRETLGALLGIALQTHLFEPGVPDADGWDAIARDAIVYRVRGAVSDAAIVFRSADAAAIAASAFGERVEPAGERALSPLERDVLDRTAAAIARTLAPICGSSERDAFERIPSIAGFRTYFEIVVAAPVEARIGIAVSNDPPPQPAGNVSIEALGGAMVDLDVVLDVASVPVRSIASLQRGDVLAVRASGDARLTIAGRTVRGGTTGIRNGRFAVAVGSAA